MKSIIVNYIVPIVLIAIAGIAVAQESPRSNKEIILKRAEQFYNEYKYDKAVEEYKRALELTEDKKKLSLRIANAYYQQKKYDKAINWYEKVVTPETASKIDAFHLFEYGMALRNEGKYSQAIYWLDKYNKQVDGSRIAQKQLFFLKNRKYYHKDTVQYELIDVGINTSANEFAPSWYLEKLLFLSDSPKLNEGRKSDDPSLFYTRIDDDTVIISPQLVFESGKKSVYGPVAVYDQGERMILTRTQKVKGAAHPVLKLFEATYDFNTSKWKEGKRLKIADDPHAYGHPTLSHDGRKLFFVSDKPGGFGGTDLYMSVKNDGEWGKPINMGDLINTPGNEMYPFLHNDTTLYFASDGHAGFGGLDVFKVALTGLDSGTVVNLGKPINSSDDDFGYIISKKGDHGYFTSNREGQDDILAFRKKEMKKLWMEGFTKDGSTPLPVNMKNVLLYDHITNEQLSKSDESGYFRMELEQEREYELMARPLNASGDYVINFEGFVKNRKDTSEIVSIKIIDPVTHKSVEHSRENGYIKFSLQEGRDYEIKVSVNDEKDRVKLSDVHVEGFVNYKDIPDLDIGKVYFLDAGTNVKISESEKNGFFEFPLKNKSDFLLRVVRPEQDKYFELVFEGFVKDKRDTTKQVHLDVIDEETGEKVYSSEEKGYARFVLEKKRKYNMVARVDSDYVNPSTLHFQGFIKDLVVPVNAGEVKIFDANTGKVLFESSPKGFFDFKMKENHQYGLSVNHHQPSPHEINFEGFVKGENDSIPTNMMIADDHGHRMSSEESGYFSFNLSDEEPFKIMTNTHEKGKKSSVADILHFEGFATEEGSNVSTGKIYMYDTVNNKLIFKSDDNGFFHFDMDPGHTYNLQAKKANKDSTKKNIKVKFTGFVKDEHDSLTHTHISIVDPETGELLVDSDQEGHFTFVMEEDKMYEVEATPVPVEKHVLKDVRLITVYKDRALKQLLLEDTTNEKVYEVNLDKEEHYYTDGYIQRKFSKNIKAKLTDIDKVVNFLQSENIAISDQFELKSIYYETNSSSLSESQRSELKKVALFLKRHPNVNMLISSFADRRGASSYNEQLTRERNQSVIKALREMGVESGRIQSVSHGELRDLEHCTNCGVQDYERHRRTDFHIISY